MALDAKTLTHENIDWIFKNINISKLNDWETNFLLSIEKRFRSKGNLTEAQIDKLCVLWDKQE